jgi:hypothetical protein
VGTEIRDFNSHKRVNLRLRVFNSYIHKTLNLPECTSKGAPEPGFAKVPSCHLPPLQISLISTTADILQYFTPQYLPFCFVNIFSYRKGYKRDLSTAPLLRLSPPIDPLPQPVSQTLLLTSSRLLSFLLLSRLPVSGSLSFLCTQSCRRGANFSVQSGFSCGFFCRCLFNLSVPFTFQTLCAVQARNIALDDFRILFDPITSLGTRVEMWAIFEVVKPSFIGAASLVAYSRCLQTHRSSCLERREVMQVEGF